MADMPWRYWGLDLKEGTRLTLAALWRHARSSEREDYLHRGGRPVFVWPTVARLVVLTSRSLRAVETDLKLLREASLIVRAKRVIGGRMLLGWELIAAAADDVLPDLEAPGDADDPAQACGVEGAEDAGHPAQACGLPRTGVRGPEPPLEPDPARACGSTPHGHAGPPRTDVRAEAREKPEVKPDVERASDDGANNATLATALPLPPARAVARRPRPDAPDGQPVGGASAARALLVELAHLFRPADAGRCFTPANPRHLELAEQLLAVAPGPADDPGVLANERLQLVLGYVRDFAELCQRDPKQAQFWRPGMLATTPGPGRSLSAWDMLVQAVDEHRRRRRDERDVAAAVQVRRDRDREEAEQLQRRRMDPAEVARATARFTGANPDQVEQLRRQGRAREADATRDEWSEIDIRRRTNEALAAAMKANDGKPLSAAQADAIRRRIRGQEATAT